MVQGGIVYPELSYRVVKCQLMVHDEIGSGFLESAYREAMAVALADEGLSCEQERPVVLRFRDRVIGSYRLDLVVEDKIVVECKTSETLRVEHESQLRNYLRASGMQLGLLMLFGSRSRYKRVVNTELARSRRRSVTVDSDRIAEAEDTSPPTECTDVRSLGSRERGRRW